MGPTQAFRHGPSFSTGRKVRSEMAGTNNDSSDYQLQCVILAVPWIGLLQTMAEHSKGRMLLPSR